ncbi:MAG: hypothetical protein ACR2HB_13390, partial [Dehalococcoidia bacterium]
LWILKAFRQARLSAAIGAMARRQKFGRTVEMLRCEGHNRSGYPSPPILERLSGVGCRAMQARYLGRLTSPSFY